MKTPDLVSFLEKAIILTDKMASLHHEGKINTFYNPSANPVYLAPEQTGRLELTVDHRADLYALGITFYEMLTSQLPFQTDDPVEMVSCHLSRQPSPPHDLYPGIPVPLSDIILVLLAKSPDQRYPDADHLKADLRQCLFLIKNQGTLADFTPIPGGMTLLDWQCRKMYGRQQETDVLLRCFKRSACGSNELLLISGHAGVGKSFLVHEARLHIEKNNATFITGKFDQYQRDIPYTALVQAFRQLIRRLLGSNDEELIFWQQRLVKNLGSNLGIITDFIPELALLVGNYPKVEKLPATESENRFHLVFLDFVHQLCDEKHPLAIFIDDLQWADAASLNLMRLLANDPEAQFLFIIGAYRNNGIHADHLLKKSLPSAANMTAGLTEISLAPLDLISVAELTADILQSTVAEVAPLAEVIFQRSQGNPFYINQFLRLVFSNQLINWNATDRRWQWELTRITNSKLNEDVVDLLVARIDLLPETTQKLLRLAACLGNHFELDTLVLIHEGDTDEIRIQLESAIFAGMLAFSGDEYIFLHDRIQQAAYSLIDEPQRRTLHLKIGYTLLEVTPPGKRDPIIFMLTDQLNMGASLITAPPARLQLAELNLAAGLKARESVAFESAFNYFLDGIGLLPDDCWQTCYELCLHLHEGMAESAFLCGSFSLMEQLTGTIIKHGKAVLDTVKAYEIRIHANLAKDEQLKAIQTSFVILNLLGIRFPANPTKAHVLLCLLKTKLFMVGKSPEELALLPDLEDQRILAVLRILASVSSAAYMAAPNLLPLIINKMVLYSVKFGNGPQSSFGYASFGLIHCSLGNISTGYKFGKLARSLLSNVSDNGHNSKTLMVVNLFVEHWKSHAKETLPSLLVGYRAGRKSGDLEYAAWCIYVRNYHKFFLGKPLAEVEKDFSLSEGTISNFNQTAILTRNQFYHQACLNLLGQPDEPCKLSGKSFNEDIFQKSEDLNILFQFHVVKLIFCFLFQKPEEAVTHANQAGKYFDAGVAFFMVAPFYFYDSLARLTVYNKHSGRKGRLLMKKVVSNQEKMKKWAHHAPMNHLHRWYLVEAELAGINGSVPRAIDYYRQAINHAGKNEFTQDEGLACEMAAIFFFSQDDLLMGRYFIRMARDCYLRWGAAAKVSQLETQYAPFFSSPANDINNSTQQQEVSLDLLSALKASQAISSEIKPEKLLSQIMNIIRENAGAQRGILLLQEGGKYCIEAEMSVDTSSVAILQGRAMEEGNLVPISIINFVARTGENIILADASHSKTFNTDPYIREKQSKSILCLPLLRQGEIIGIIYLENNLIAGAFTAERQKTLSLLGSQAAISIENARLFKKIQNLSLHMEEKREEEMSRVARDIHDELGQGLTALNMNLAWLSRSLPEEEKETAEKIMSMKAQVSTTLQAVKRISVELRPTVLDHFGLNAALEWQVEEFSKQTGIPCELKLPVQQLALEKNRDIAMFRLLQESLTNIARHAGANLVSVILKEKDNHLHLTIVDNGCGITQVAQTKPMSFGLLGMRERVHALGGTLQIKGLQNQGTTISVTIPSR